MAEGRHAAKIFIQIINGKLRMSSVDYQIFRIIGAFMWPLLAFNDGVVFYGPTGDQSWANHYPADFLPRKLPMSFIL